MLQFENMLRSIVLLLCLISRVTEVTMATSRARTRIMNASGVAIARDPPCRGVRYSGLGCFTLDHPFNNTQWLPQSPTAVNTKFSLYTRQNPTLGDTLDSANRTSLTSSHIRSNLPIKILIHGFLQYGSMEFLVNMTRALLQNSPMNVIVVDWGSGATFPYSRAVANTRLVANQTVKLLRAIFQVTGNTPDSVHLIGHSLGAHVAGYVGTRIHGISRITGLDPAQPNFSGFDPAVRLDPTDAHFVDVIHTDAVPYDTVKGYGIIEPVGHIDFYPNGGRDQPGCLEESSVIGFVEDVVSNGITNAEVDLSCSHERSTELFTASIPSEDQPVVCHFTSFPCPSEESFWQGDCHHCGNRPCPTMGYQADLYFRSRGKFYLNTTGSHPFCSFHYVVTVSLASPVFNIAGRLKLQLNGTLNTVDWIEIELNTTQSSQFLTKLVVTQSDIGEVNQVSIRFMDRQPTRSMTVDWISVNSMMRSPTRYFQQGNMVVEGVSPLTVTDWSNTPPYS